MFEAVKRVARAVLSFENGFEGLFGASNEKLYVRIIFQGV